MRLLLALALIFLGMNTAVAATVECTISIARTTGEFETVVKIGDPHATDDYVMRESLALEPNLHTTLVVQVSSALDRMNISVEREEIVGGVRGVATVVFGATSSAVGELSNLTGTLSVVTQDFPSVSFLEVVCTVATPPGVPASPTGLKMQTMVES